MRGKVRDVRWVGDHRREGEVEPSRARGRFRPLRLSALEQPKTGEGIDGVVLGEYVDPEGEVGGRDLAGLEETVEEVARDGVTSGEGAGDPASTVLEEEAVFLVGLEVRSRLMDWSFASCRTRRTSRRSWKIERSA